MISYSHFNKNSTLIYNGPKNGEAYTAVMNYLDIKGLKYRTPTKINRKEWTAIRNSINSIDFNKLALVNEKSSVDSKYVIETLNLKKETKIYSVQNEDELKNLKSIFFLIRKSI